MKKEAFDVEMAGVEPASEEKTIETTTYVFCFLRFVSTYPTDRTMLKQPRIVPVSRDSLPVIGEFR